MLTLRQAYTPPFMIHISDICEASCVIVMMLSEVLRSTSGVIVSMSCSFLADSQHSTCIAKLPCTDDDYTNIYGVCDDRGMVGTLQVLLLGRLMALPTGTPHSARFACRFSFCMEDSLAFVCEKSSRASG